MLERSAWKLRAVTFLHALALVAAFANALPITVRMVLGIAVGISLCRTLTQSERVQALTLKTDGTWEILKSDGPHSGVLQPEAIVTPWLVILPIRIGMSSLTLLICRDGADPESFRRLRVYLRINALRGIQPD